MTSKSLETFLSFLREIEQRYHMAEADEQEANDETQDILHSLELQNHSYQEFAKLSKELKSIRKRRRVAKDTMFETAPVLEWVENNREVVKSLERLLGSVRKAEKCTENRIYTPKIKRGQGNA